MKLLESYRQLIKDGRRPRVLVVDDQPMNIRVLHELLRDDCEVTMALDGERALAMCQEQPPDLVLLDVVMPGIDGLEVCRRLKADAATADIPVIFVTGQESVEDEVMALEAGAVDFITKPVKPVVVRARVHSQLLLKLQGDMLRQIASLDGLTGVANRRRFEEMLQAAWRTGLREHAPCALLMIDIDYFKKYNDHYGHPAGDACLREVAQALASCMSRPYDLIARYGGEEFVALLPGTDADGAAEIARRMLEAIAHLDREHAASPVSMHVTVSIGGASCVPLRKEGAMQLVERADAQLYIAKRGGRARLSVESDIEIDLPSRQAI